MLEQLTPYLLIILIAAIIVVIWLLLRKKVDGGEEKLITMMEKLSALSEQNKELRQVMDSKLSETHKANQAQFGQATKIIQGITGQSAKLITEVTAKLTKLDETNKQVVNFSAQLQNLQDILKNPKQRGVLGEYFLEETLKNVLPSNSYQMQYAFKDGSIVDAVVFVKDKIIPVDSKFSLENYEKILNCNDADTREKLEKQFKQDLKLRIDETSKYVKPTEKTMDFAFMFIPSEAIYYDLLINKIGAVKVNTRDLIEYAFRDKHVIIVSPTSFLAYLQTVLQGLRAMQIEESAKEIMVNVQKLDKHINSYDDFMKKLGVSMSTTVNHYNNAYKEFKKIDKDVARITDGESKLDPMVLDRPKTEE
ncbi:DNA recombination protein RmuC [Candidatus Falkowbacteria bacterium CG11_big_fil_rev_8_21_14_0_20_39_10]|uniref:DNA recombination protein RmuC n=1 Tax=Candidatus Falkowbacteria bacterium CG11_big_fil_rev_8_21_14_0_20_39_10 TaxID=1974570 RepID=A0A2M6K9A8_9BACT|nr:MAG: DNA recombination protein RmuC [Candidatus Falkowbacteria bacterium CG11_big_fil_rev_8_21_14_0_20_39_10]